MIRRNFKPAVVLAAALLSAAGIGRADAECVPASYAGARVQKAREATKEEIYRALVEGLREQGVSAAALPRIEEISVGLPVRVAEPEPGFALRGVEADPVRAVVRLRMVAARECGRMPFYVTVRDESGALRAISPRRIAPVRLAAGGQALARPEQLPAVKSEPIVRPGARAMLFVNAAGFRIRMPVVALQAGAAGETIRVRAVGSNRMMYARVVAANRLEQSIGEAR